MNTVRRGLFRAFVVVAVVVSVVWVVPTVAGPVVECGPVDRVTCREVWPLMLDSVGSVPGWSDWLPITHMEILESAGGACGTFRYTRWGLFGGGAINDFCL